ncbi:MAG: LPS export ABC transporter permease LptF [Burkholderiaceae bacterium]|nr:LPS export ABC transporter permease LptF [Burkholderiaceae bacterium]
MRRELANLAGVVFATLFTILVTTTLIRMLGRAASGKVDTASLIPLIVFSAINALPVLLVLTLYVSVLIAVTRAYRDSEMVIWFASGRSLLHWVRPVLGFAAPFVALIAALTFAVSPWANRQSSEYKQRFEQREDVSQISAGQFRESASADRVFFVESLSEDQQSVRNVFVTQRGGERVSIVAAVSGRIEARHDGERFLVLEKGRRYDGEETGPAFRVMEFERYGLRLEPRLTDLRDDSAKVKTTFELIADPVPRNLGELVWRIGLPISAAALALLAIPLSSINPRVGRSINLIVALLIYVTYSNLLSLTQAWVAQERLPFSLGVWLIHAVLLAGVAALFWRRIRIARPAIRLRRART